MSSVHLAGRPLPALPAVISHEVILGLLRALDEGGADEQCFAAHRLAALLEAEEAKYRAVVGDPHANPSLRNHYTVGKILAFIKEEEDVYDKICDTWVQSRNATLEQQVAGLRLLLATLECWLFQYPLTEEALVERLGHWSVAGLEKAPLPGEGAPGGRQEMLEEARQAYALGVLSIALTNEEYADEAVRTPLVPAACRYLRRAVTAMAAGAPGGAAGSSGAAAAGASADDGPAAGGGEGESPEVAHVRQQRLLAALRCLMCTGEYVESLGPFLQFCGVDTVCTLLRHIRAASAAGGGARGGGGGGGAAAQRLGWLMHEALQVVCSLLAHRKFAELLVEAGGVQLLLALPRNQHSYPGLSLALFGLAALPLAFERACALPAPVPREMVAAALSLLTSGSDVARKNGALFLDHALSTRVVCKEFDSQEGLHRLLFPLRRLLALTREGGGMHPDVRTERQVRRGLEGRGV
ncbi:HIV-1 Vpr-binding protein [Monoraphidium neglectum]|uniref:HIV-1 Vpr-binding protein n=1 Tax=Monoraphidium neglectum TaxID=145388 RepID=A0A0D2J9V3_9CHLO|nr:HIV-1 Vpr-binding protein [Monoraphidium neglectum]KIY96542.1 HIV-1 Vpr-binding protein [Monoraphidium neglectum]|eukprot:XP_013895562.1 HIV-1 Vpr-binding protein [Monoraphidium neglectum]